MNDALPQQQPIDSAAIPLEDIVDIEEFAKAGRNPPSAKQYRIRIDRAVYVVKVPAMTGLQLLVLAGKQPPEQFAIYEKMHRGGNRKIEPTETVSFTKPGVERFMTLPLDQTEGLASPRRDFRLPEEDERFLNNSGYPWETVAVEGIQRLIIYGIATGAGYNHAHVDVNLRIEPPYPDVQIDMAYISPALTRQDGRPIGSIVDDPFDGKVWQRWSRHRTSSNPWRPGVDNVESHLALVGEWFRQELLKR